MANPALIPSEQLFNERLAQALTTPDETFFFYTCQFLKERRLEVCGNGLRKACGNCWGEEKPCEFVGSGRFNGVYQHWSGPKSIVGLVAYNAQHHFSKSSSSYYKDASSYGIKHWFQSGASVPEYCQVYVCNGTFIVYMAMQGFEMKPVDEDSPNVYFKLKLV
jgi:hypothetical protein